MNGRKAKQDLHMTDIPTLAWTNQRSVLSYDRLHRRPMHESIRRVKGGSRAGRGWHADRTKEGSLLYNKRKREGKRKKGFAKQVWSENSREESWPIEWCYDTTTFLLRTPTKRAGRSTYCAAGRLGSVKWPCCRRTALDFTGYFYNSEPSFHHNSSVPDLLYPAPFCIVPRCP